MPPEEEPTGTARLEIVVRGRVQGVGYRFFVRRRAAALGLVGWVANEMDGSVRSVAEGPRTALQQLVIELADGPSGARVEAVEPIWGPPSGAFRSFDVRFGSHGGD